MANQSYSSHTRYYTPHHFIFYPLILLAIIVSIICMVNMPRLQLVWAAIASIFFFLGWLAFMMRQHYSLTLQNRLVRLELRLRYYQLTQRRLEEIESRLSFNQIAALRFASDEELPALTERAITNNLTPKSIKNAIVNWLPDHMRV